MKISFREKSDVGWLKGCEIGGNEIELNRMWRQEILNLTSKQMLKKKEGSTKLAPSWYAQDVWENDVENILF